MRVDQVNVEDRRALARFIRLERELLGHHPLYVAPLDADVRKQLSGKSASSIDTEQALFLLSGNGDRGDSETSGARNAESITYRTGPSHRLMT